MFNSQDYIKRKLSMPRQQFNSKNNETKPLQRNRSNYTHQTQQYYNRPSSHHNNINFY